MLLPEWAYVRKKPESVAQFKRYADDFHVAEQLDFEFSGDGEHFWLWVEKAELTTVFVQECLASFIGVPIRDVSYSGMKDKKAVARQWYSVRVPSPNKREAIRWEKFEAHVDEVLVKKYGNIRCEEEKPRASVLNYHRHYRKLRIGVHRSNQFFIRLRSFSGDEVQLKSNIDRLLSNGFPNYYGPQRFGIDGENLRRAQQLFSGKRMRRPTRSVALSSARAFVFNGVLSERIKDCSWCEPLDGDIFQLSGTRSIFKWDAGEPSSEPLDSLIKRLTERDIHLTGPLWGSKGSVTERDAAAAELQAVNAMDLLPWCSALEKFGVKSDRRALCAFANNFSYTVEDSSVIFEFSLPRGSFATALLREIVQIDGQPESKASI